MSFWQVWMGDDCSLYGFPGAALQDFPKNLGEGNMRSITKIIIGLLAISAGGGVALKAALGLVLGGWDTSGELGGVNLAPFGALLAGIGVLVAYGGFRLMLDEK